MARPDYLNVYLLTFNCGRAFINPTAFAPHFFDALKPQSHGTVTPNTSDEAAVTTSGLPGLVVLNLQEVAPIAHSFLGGSFLTPYLDRFTTLLELAAAARLTSGSGQSRTNPSHDQRPQYVNFMTRNLGLTAIMLFVRADLVSRLDGIMTAGVGVGVQETGNKGAVGVRLGWRLNSTTFEDDADKDTEDVLNLTFVAAHLAPMEGELQRRHQDFKDITKGLIFTSETKTYTSASATVEGSESAPLLSEASDGATTSSSSFTSELNGMYTGPTHLFFAGDLNYRTSLYPPSTAEVVSFPQLNVDPTHEKHYSHLLERDQLNIARRKGETLHGLTEQEIQFPPTYKYKYRLGDGKDEDGQSNDIIEEADTERWEWASHRWPSWCDRILFFQPQSGSGSAPAQSTTQQSKTHHQLIPQGYTALPMITTSDHRPVALSILIPLIKITSEISAELAKSSPPGVRLDPNWHGRRAAARRREIVVGVFSYLALTREGNLLLFGGFVALFGGLVFANGWRG